MMDIDQHIERVDWGKQQDSGEVLLSPAWEVFILGISILSVLNLLLVGLVRNPHLDQVFVIMDSLLTFIFLLDLTRRLVVAQDRRKYLVEGYGWVDVIAAFPILRILRVLRIVRMVMVMRRLGGPLNAFKAFFSNRAAGGLHPSPSGHGRGGGGAALPHGSRAPKHARGRGEPGRSGPLSGHRHAHAHLIGLRENPDAGSPAAGFRGGAAESDRPLDGRAEPPDLGEPDRWCR